MKSRKGGKNVILVKSRAASFTTITFAFVLFCLVFNYCYAVILFNYLEKEKEKNCVPSLVQTPVPGPFTSCNTFVIYLCDKKLIRV